MTVTHFHTFCLVKCQNQSGTLSSQMIQRYALVKMVWGKEQVQRKVDAHDCDAKSSKTGPPPHNSFTHKVQLQKVYKPELFWGETGAPQPGDAAWKELGRWCCGAPSWRSPVWWQAAHPSPSRLLSPERSGKTSAPSGHSAQGNGWETN